MQLGSKVATAVLGILLLLAICVHWPRGGEATSAVLAEQALEMADSEISQQAAAELAGCSRDAIPELRVVYQQSGNAQVRATCIQGLGRLYDYDSMDLLLTAMSDPSALVRARANRAVVRMLGFDGHFDANGPEADRKRIIGFYRLQWEQLRGSQHLKNFEKTIDHRYGKED